MLDDAALLKMIRKKIDDGRYRFTKHAIEQQYNRDIDVPDVLSVLRNGTHEVRKTIFETKRQIWKYAIRGRTEDKEVRVIVAFNDEMIIITVIDVKK